MAEPKKLDSVKQHKAEYSASSREPQIIEVRPAQFLAAEGRSIAGRHHEIYFSDPRRTKPEKLKTLLRWPVKSGT